MLGTGLWSSPVPFEVDGITQIAVTGKNVRGALNRATAPDTVATFTTLENTTAGSFAATVDWGDGGPTGRGQVVAMGSGYAVQASHTYKKAGSYAVSVRVEGPGGASGTGAASATVEAGTITPHARTIRGFVGKDLKDPTTVATFETTLTDVGASDFTATVDWGDGTAPGAGTILANPDGTYTVNARHKYEKKGEYPTNITVSTTDAAISASNQGIAKIQPIYVVNSVKDDGDDNLSDGIATTGKTLDDGTPEVTLRAAIEQANHDGGAEIDFDIPLTGGTAYPTIVPGWKDPKAGVQSAWPALTAPITIDGTTQPGSHFVALDGSSSRGQLKFGGMVYSDAEQPLYDGLVVQGGGSELAGLYVWGFTDWGVVVRGGGGNTLHDLTIGHAPAGHAPAMGVGNGLSYLESTYVSFVPNLHGGGLLIDGSSGNTIRSVDLRGNAAIQILNWVARTEPVDLNQPVNLDNGLDTHQVPAVAIVGAGSTGNVLAGLNIGPYGAYDGGRSVRPMPYVSGAGVMIVEASGNVVGLPGDSADRRITIAGDPSDTQGVVLVGAGARNNVVQNATVTGCNWGVWLGDGASGNRVGGNVLASNGVGLLMTSASGNVVQGNVVRANTSDGMLLMNGSAGNLIGSDAPGGANLVSGNGRAGIAVGHVSGVGFSRDRDAATVGNRVLGNLIWANAGPEIDLGDDGTTPNHNVGFVGAAAGPNHWQNVPIWANLLAAAATVDEKGTLTVRGSLSAPSGATYRLEFFASPPDPRVYTDRGLPGIVFAGSYDLTIGALDFGSKVFSVTLPLVVGVGSRLVATATGPDGDTSEFSRPVIVARLGPTPGDVTRQTTITTRTIGGPPVVVNSIRTLATANPAARPAVVTEVLTITNTGGRAIRGPIALAIDDLANARLRTHAATSIVTQPIGSPVVRIPTRANMLKPGQKLRVVLRFTPYDRATPISFTPRVLAGRGAF